ncbi:hypothetical protein AAC387_Pa05g2351 [Persea americana]
MTESNGKRPRLKLSSLFTTFPDSLCFSDALKSPKSAMDNKKSPRNFEGGVVGLGIVAAMNESNETHDPFSSPMSARAAKAALSPRSVPIPIVPSKTGVKLREPMSEEEGMQLSESYTCVISHVGNEPIQKHEYFERTVGDYMENFGPPKVMDCGVTVPVADFLSSCNLCRKKLHGLDIFMYRGEKAFCSAECRRQQILSDEHKEKCGYEALKSLDYSSSPCSDPRIFSTGVAAA